MDSQGLYKLKHKDFYLHRQNKHANYVPCNFSDLEANPMQRQAIHYSNLQVEKFRCFFLNREILHYQYRQVQGFLQNCLNSILIAKVRLQPYALLIATNFKPGVSLNVLSGNAEA